MKQIIGLLLIIIGIVLGLYTGLWWAFIGGIIQVIRACQAPHLDAVVIALGVVKIVFAGFIGWVTGILLIAPGAALLKSK